MFIKADWLVDWFMSAMGWFCRLVVCIVSVFLIVGWLYWSSVCNEGWFHWFNVGRSNFVIGDWLLVFGYWFLVIGYLLFVIGDWWLVVFYVKSKNFD